MRSVIMYFDHITAALKKSRFIEIHAGPWIAVEYRPNLRSMHRHAFLQIQTRRDRTKKNTTMTMRRVNGGDGRTVSGRPIGGVGRIPTADEHRERRQRLGSVGKWFLSRNPRHADYFLDALRDACEMLSRRLGKPLLDEAPDENVGVRSGYFPAIDGVYQLDEKVSEDEIAAFKQSEGLLRKSMPPPLKNRAYIAHRHFDDHHYPPPRRAALTGRITTVTQMALAA
jgi:hypothetical protein